VRQIASASPAANARNAGGVAAVARLHEPPGRQDRRRDEDVWRGGATTFGPDVDRENRPDFIRCSPGGGLAAGRAADPPDTSTDGGRPPRRPARSLSQASYHTPGFRPAACPVAARKPCRTACFLRLEPRRHRFQAGNHRFSGCIFIPRVSNQPAFGTLVPGSGTRWGIAAHNFSTLGR
jgi:hypothetical protein